MRLRYQLVIPPQKKSAFTLIESLIALTLFATAAVVTLTVFINGLASTKKTEAQLFLKDQAQAILNEVQVVAEQNTIDYEAYYARNGLGETGWETQNYGFYAQSFYNPGTDGWATGPYSGLPDYYGAACPSDSTLHYPEGCSSETPVYSELDTNTGAHPFSGIDSLSASYADDPATMNAFCESGSECESLNYTVTNELIVVNGTGDRRTIVTRELLEEGSSDYRLSKVVLSGSDSDADGVVDAWVCTEDYTCSDTYSCGLDDCSIPSDGDLTDTDSASGSDFMPFTPSTVNVEYFYVVIAPLEDPYRAFAEEDSQIQPGITVFLTLSLSEDYPDRVIGEEPSLSVQRTFFTGVYQEIESYE